MDWLATVFLGAFLFGLLFAVGSVVLGLGHVGIHDLGHVGHDAGLGGHDAGGHGLHADQGDGTSSHWTAHVSPWNLTGLMAFVAWFGGVGYLALTSWELVAWLSLLLALVAGLGGWSLVYVFFNRVLTRGERVMDPAEYRMVGTVARVTDAIGPGRTGEIQFSRAGTRRSESARGVDGAAIERGTEVVVVRYEGGIAYVEPWQAFVEEGAPRRR